MRIFPFVLFVLIAQYLNAQSSNEQPKIIVGIVVDQMRYDYLYRYSKHYGNDGLKRLLREGLSCENTHYDYIPTYTGPGHACVYTGTGPAGNGVIANEWWDPEWKKHRYVTADPTIKPVGTDEKAGQHSPAVMLSTTITDELRLSNNFKSKVVGVCLKDRGSILPAGHIPNAAYWFNDKTGSWITSSFYPDSLGLPTWVQQFNDQKLAEKYCNRVWKKQEGITYEESFAGWASKYDRAKYAASLSGGFPHNLAALRKTMGLGVLRFTPWGNTITLDFALTALDSMQLGQDEYPDFLCLSFSSTDYAGHQFGIHAEETEDVYISLDRELARLFNTLDTKFGKDNYLVFLTADHGGSETPLHLKEIGIPADVLRESKIDSSLSAHLAKIFNDTTDVIHEISNQQIWFKPNARTNVEQLTKASKEWLRKMKGIYAVHDRAEIMSLPSDYWYAPALRRGYHPRRSGDLFFQLDPNWHPDDTYFGQGGATHGSSYAYDTHVPLLWMGKNIKPGRYYGNVSVSDIAPTLAAMLQIMEPSATTGKVIERVME
jgi:predicted AlkP superfamily pyrophosphatase or phosphodiesterase